MQDRRQGVSTTLVTGWNPNNKMLLTFDEASNALSISRGMLTKQARLGRIKVTRIGRCARISQAEVLRLCEGKTLGGGK
jgi:excisionase family DNA binding protein